MRNFDVANNFEDFTSPQMALRRNQRKRPAKRKKSRPKARKQARRGKKVHYAKKTGQPYILLRSGKARFIKGKRRK